MSYIEFKNIVKKYGDNTVLKDINVSIDEGELVTLLGPSGCGKSTLLRCMAGLEDVTEGSIYMDGKDITNVNPKDRGIGMVFQQYSLFPNMNIEQNVAFGLKIKKVSTAEIKKKTERMLDIVGLSDKAKAYPAELSGGQQQRAALARALVTEPKVLLLDEPLSAIDALLRHSLQVEIRRIQKEMNITAIFVTHDQEEAMVMSDRIQLMHQGVIEQSGSPAELYTQPATKFAATFIGHYNIYGGAAFRKMTGQSANAADVAFRPELVRVSSEPDNSPSEYHMKATVKGSLPHGNIMRYEMDCCGEEIDVDILFDDGVVLKDGTTCYLSVRKDACIAY